MSWLPHHQEETRIPATTPSEAGEAPCEPVGEEVQRLSVLQSLPNLLKGDGSLCMQRVVPKVQLALPNASTEFQIAASSTFLTILEKKLVHPRTFTQTFLQSILSSIDSRDPVVANAWLETLLDVMDLLPSEVIRSEILPIAITKGQISQSVKSRLIACKLLGKVCTRFESYLLKKEALPVVHSLCQDVNYEVRACICSQLKYVAKGLGPEGAKVALLPSLVDLANDEEIMVRLAAVEAVVDLLPLLQADVLKHTIVPLIKKICTQSMNSEDDVLSVISLHLGKMCLGLDNYLTMNEKSWFMMYYQQMAQLGVPNLGGNFLTKDFPGGMQDSSDSLTDHFIICRQNCAFNFPAMAMFSTRQGDCFHEQLYSTFADLACDPYFLVRRTIACGIHEVTSVLGPVCGMVKNELVKLLRDDAEEVLQGLIPNIATTMELLAKTGNIGPDNMDTTAIEIGRALVKCEAEISQTHNWRLQSEIISQMECLPNCLPSEFIHSHFVPIMFTRVHTARPVPCRVAAARTLLVFLRYNQKQMQRSDIRARIINELGRGHSCYSRMLFVKLCVMVIQMFSRRYFKDHFFFQLLELTGDAVPNIRMLVVVQLPQLKEMLRLPTDRKLLLAMETSVRKLLLSERDRDVSLHLNNVIQDLDKIEVPIELNTVNCSKEELDDQRKLEEEIRMSSSKNDSTKRKNIDGKYSLPPGGTQRAISVPAPMSKRGFTSRGMDSKDMQPKVGGLTTGSSANIQRSVTAFKSKDKRLPTQSSTSTISSSRESMSSLEDEFYVDAGIRIPQQLAASDFTPFPSRIPNLREILFKNRNSSENATKNSNLQSPKISVSISVEAKQESDVPSSTANTSSESKLRYSSPSKQNTPTNVPIDRTTINSSKSTVQKPTASSVSKRNSGIFNSSKLEQQCTASPVNKSGLLEHKQKDATVIANRRHSYMDGEKLSRNSVSVKNNEIPVLRRSMGGAASRRHSYIEKVDDCEKNIQGQAVRRSQNLSSNKRHSYIETQSVKSGEATTSRKSSVICRSYEGRSMDTFNKRRSLNFTHTQQKSSRRVSSLDRGSETEATSAASSAERQQSSVVKQIPKHPHSLSVENKRRHSSLERDALERLRSPTYAKVSCIRMRSGIISRNEVHHPSDSEFSLRDTNSESDRIGRTAYKNNFSSNSLKEFTNCPASDENVELVTLRKGNRLSLSKIPRGGAASCHSSPGGSRASSPTASGPARGNATRVRQRTAPNSRASSPTGSKGHQRLSLGSLNCYMSSLKLAESTSRLPVRKT